MYKGGEGTTGMEEVRALCPLFRIHERVLQTIRLKASLSTVMSCRLGVTSSAWIAGGAGPFSLPFGSQAVPSEREVTSDNK